MAEFLFETWPGGFGPILVQGLLAAAGAALGIRMIDDVKAWREARLRVRADRDPDPR